MIKYVATELAMEDESFNSCIFHGIAALGDGQVMDIITDISSNRQAVLTLVEMLNKYSASLIHFKDIVYDFIADL